MPVALSLADPIPADLAGRASTSSSPAPRQALTDSPWRLLLLIALPYWAAISVVRVVSHQLFAAGGDLAFKPALLGITPEVRIVHHILMSIVVLSAYRAALAVGWPGDRRALAILKHAGLALGIALLSRPLFVLAMQLVLDVRVDWPGVFLPPQSRAVKLWASMGLEFLTPYLFGLAIIAGVWIFTALERSELERVNLRAAWTQARLHAMRMQLNPHFLFNTFNMIATLLNADPQPARARSLVLALSDLYRRTLIAAEREWMPLSEELALACDYLRIQAARFEGRLTYEIECGADRELVDVPALLLQPLVENAVLHGAADDRQSLRVWIRVELQALDDAGSVLSIEVGNATDGLLGSSPGPGIGLRNTRTRLAACYGGRAHLEARAVETGRFVARVTVPCSDASQPQRAAAHATASATA